MMCVKIQNVWNSEKRVGLGEVTHLEETMRLLSPLDNSLSAGTVGSPG